MQISKEAKVNYDYLEQLGYSYTITTNFKKIDTIPVFEAKWSSKATKNEVDNGMQKLRAWLKLKLNDTTLVVKQVE